MKKIISLLLAMALVMTSAAALADMSDLDRFAPYTSVDMEVFKKAGWECSFDNFEFNAEIYPKTRTIEFLANRDGNKILDAGNYSYVATTYKIKMDLKVIYSAGSCIVIPRFIFVRSGSKPYYDDRMTDVYIVNGENRYNVDVSGCSRSSSSKYYTATDSSVEPMYLGGMLMLQDLAEYPQGVFVKMGSYTDEICLENTDLAAIKTFYETCKEAGVFEQSYLQNHKDDYSIITLFNENGVQGTESASDDLNTPAPTEDN